MYVAAKENLPHVGMTVSLPTGERGTVTHVDIFRERVAVQVRTESDTRTVIVATETVKLAVTAVRGAGDAAVRAGHTRAIQRRRL